MTQEEWLAEFSKYQQSPEFRLAHSHMTVEDFKFIYFMEWAHRMWGRCAGMQSAQLSANNDRAFLDHPTDKPTQRSNFIIIVLCAALRCAVSACNLVLC